MSNLVGGEPTGWAPSPSPPALALPSSPPPPLLLTPLTSSVSGAPTDRSVLQEVVGCHVDVIVGSPECLQGVDPREAHFDQPGNLREGGEQQQQIMDKGFNEQPPVCPPVISANQTGN